MNSLEYCINNGLYEEIKNFTYRDWNHELVNKLIDLIKEDISILSKIGYVHGIFASSELLEFILRKKIYIKELTSFQTEAWTSENIDLFIDVYDIIKESNNNETIEVPKGLQYNAQILNFYLNHEDGLGTEKFYSDSAWTSDNKQLFLQKLKLRNDLTLSSNWRNATGLKILLENNLLNYALQVSYPIAWTEENISSFCTKLSQYNHELTTNIPYTLQENSKVLLAVIKSKKYQKISEFRPMAWAENCFESFAEIVEEYLNQGYSFPYPAGKNKKVLLKTLESGYFSYCFDESFQDEECARALLSFKPKSLEQLELELIGHVNQFTRPIIYQSPTILKTYLLDNNYKVRDFKEEAWSEECIGLLSSIILKIPDEEGRNIITYSHAVNKLKKSSKLLKTYLLNAEKFNYQNISIFEDEAWTEECIDIILPFFTNKFHEFSLIFTFTNALKKSPKVLKNYILNEVHNLTSFAEEAWTEDNIILLAKSKLEYLKTSLMPVYLKSNKKFLQFILENKKYSILGNFNKDVYTNEIIDEVIELYRTNKIAEISYRLYEIPYAYYKIMNLENKKTTLPSEQIINDDIINKFINDKLLTDFKLIYNIGLYLTSHESNVLTDSQKAFFKFIYETKSEKILILVRSLINDDISQLNLLFQNGITPYFQEYLIYDYDYIMYCTKNGIEIENNDLTYHQYLKHTILYPDLHSSIIIDKDNLHKYFDENGIKIELLDDLFNPRCCQFLHKLLESNSNLQFDEKKKYVVHKYSKIENNKLKIKFFGYIYDHFDDVSYEKIEDVYNIFKRIEYSNSNEIRAFQEIIIEEVLKFDNPEEKLKEIESIFIKNNIPPMGKIYSVFKLLNPTYRTFRNIENSSTISPTLKNSSNRARDIIIFSDLIRISLGSNNKAFLSYLNSLVEGNEIYMDIINGKRNYNQLSSREKEIVDIFVERLKTLYENTLLSINKQHDYIGNPISNLNELKSLLSPGKDDSQLPDRIVRMFCHFAGFDTVEEIKKYRSRKLKERDTIHRDMEKAPFKLEKGDFVKGIGSVNYLRNILQNGSLAKEFLGDSAGSNGTPLDTDLSIIETDGLSIRDTINQTEARGYGNIFFVLKGDNRFTHTRRADGVESPSNYKNHKLEAFYTGVAGKTHYGIRTGFASSEIDYIVADEYYDRIGFELALSGIYIPVIDRDGNLKFSSKEYDDIRSKMNGLKFYNNDSFTLSPELKSVDLTDILGDLKNNKEATHYKRKCIESAIKEALNSVNLKLKTTMDGDLTENIVELLDTGSTGRGTNVPGDGDFDFIMRVDRNIMLDEERLNTIKRAILKKFNRNSNETGEFRLADVSVPNLEQLVDIDISFITKTNKTEYATENCVQDRLSTIENQYPEDYPYVLANIIRAKELLKQGECYKPKHARNPQGGLGGVGVENWILQHGGSLLTAAKSFLEVAHKCSSLREFQTSYPIYDFGINHMAAKRGHYPYDNFVYNLNEVGYKKMKQILTAYVEKLEKENSKKR